MHVLKNLDGTVTVYKDSEYMEFVNAKTERNQSVMGSAVLAKKAIDAEKEAVAAKKREVAAAKKHEREKAAAQEEPKQVRRSNRLENQGRVDYSDEEKTATGKKPAQGKDEKTAVASITEAPVLTKRQAVASITEAPVLTKRQAVEAVTVEAPVLQGASTGAQIAKELLKNIKSAKTEAEITSCLEAAAKKIKGEGDGRRKPSGQHKMLDRMSGLTPAQVNRIRAMLDQKGSRVMPKVRNICPHLIYVDSLGTANTLVFFITVLAVNNEDKGQLWSPYRGRARDESFIRLRYEGEGGGPNG